MTITIPERQGRCRWCGCTDERACPAGCSWGNRQQTLCSACVELDRLVRSAQGRRGLAEVFQDLDHAIRSVKVNPRGHAEFVLDAEFVALLDRVTKQAPRPRHGHG